MLLVLGVLLAWPATAAKPGAVRAAAAGDRDVAAGRPTEAMAHYAEAWRIDPHPEYLLLLARAEHLAGKLNQAMEHYEAFLAAPTTSVQQVARARGWAAEIEQLRVAAQVRDAYVRAYEQGRVREAEVNGAAAAREMSLVQQAEVAARLGDEGKAAGLYLSAYRAARERDDGLLFKAAVAAQYAGDWRAATQHLEEFVRRAPAGAPEYGEALMRLEQVRRKLGEASRPPPPVVQVPPPPPLPIVADRPRDGDRATVGWTLVKIGAALTLVGAGSYAWAYNEQVALEAQLQPESDGRIRAISHEEALARQQSVNGHLATSYVIGGVGLAAAGVGTYLVLTAPKRVSVVPLPTAPGVLVSMRF